MFSQHNNRVFPRFLWFNQSYVLDYEPTSQVVTELQGINSKMSKSCFNFEEKVLGSDVRREGSFFLFWSTEEKVLGPLIQEIIQSALFDPLRYL